MDPQFISGVEFCRRQNSGSNCRLAAITQPRKARFFAEQKMRPNFKNLRNVKLLLGIIQGLVSCFVQWYA
jgi:hypothetical protein